ncbi:alpha/beta hydrolase [Neobacillus mesonae]|nr:alpha/beta hydrolase [Neobacillus mesonae]
MEKVQLGSHVIAYRDHGEGQPVVLLHGFCGSSDYFEEILPQLMKQYRCIVPDLRGHGESGTPNSSCGIDEMADDIVELLNHLGIQQASIFGHSLGGYITLSIAARYPNRLETFGLIHSTAYPDSEEAKEKRLKAVSTIQTEGMNHFIDSLVPGLFAAEHQTTMVSKIDRIREIGYRTSPQGASNTAIAMRERSDLRHVLEQADVPVLLVAGEQDAVVPPERTFTADGPKITQAIIKGAGHMSMVEAPEELLRVLTDFLSSNVR